MELNMLLYEMNETFLLYCFPGILCFPWSFYEFCPKREIKKMGL